MLKSVFRIMLKLYYGISKMRHIISDAKFLKGKPYLGGARLSVSLLLGELSEGKTISDIIRKYPQLMREDIVHILDYASKIVDAHPKDADLLRNYPE